MSKLSDFLSKQKLDPRRVIAASKEVERLRPEDRGIKLARRQAKAGGDVPEKVKETAAKKPRSGAPLTGPTMRAAALGQPIGGPAKTKIVRAVNHLLTQKKKDAIALRDLF